MSEISILVRAHNDEALIGKTLEGIFAQKTSRTCEVIVCDDNSSDRTVEIAKRFPVRFVSPPQGPYKPGRTLNELVRQAKGEIVVFNNSDAVPLDENWLEELICPLVEDKDKKQFTFANQMPRKDATALVRKDSLRAFGDGKVQATWNFFFSLASSATWKRFLVETPFDEEIQYSEDVEWTWRNMRSSVVYCPNAHVEHSHNYTLKELVKRFKGEGKADARIFGARPTLGREVAGALVETARDWIYLIKSPHDWKEIPSAPIRRLVQRVSHWKGTRS